MATIIGLYGTDEGFPRHIIAAEDPQAEYESLIAGALDGEQGEIHSWIAERTLDQDEVRFEALQTNVTPAETAFYIGYWESQFAEVVRSSNGDRIQGPPGALAVLARIQERKGGSDR